MKKYIIPLLVFILFSGVMPEVADACPNCKESYMEDGGQSPVSSGFNTSIVFMMMMPFIVIGGFILRLWIARRRGADEENEEPHVQEAH